MPSTFRIIGIIRKVDGMPTLLSCRISAWIFRQKITLSVSRKNTFLITHQLLNTNPMARQSMARLYNPKPVTFLKLYVSFDFRNGLAIQMVETRRKILPILMIPPLAKVKRSVSVFGVSSGNIVVIPIRNRNVIKSIHTEK